MDLKLDLAEYRIKFYIVRKKKISFILHTNSDVAFKPFAIEVA